MKKKKKRKIKTKLLLEYKVDLTSIKERKDLPCPKCGANLSSEDRKGIPYSIKEMKTRGNQLKELVVECNRCVSLIHLSGFEIQYKLQ